MFWISATSVNQTAVVSHCTNLFHSGPQFPLHYSHYRGTSIAPLKLSLNADRQLKLIEFIYDYFKRQKNRYIQSMWTTVTIYFALFFIPKNCNPCSFVPAPPHYCWVTWCHQEKNRRPFQTIQEPRSPNTETILINEYSGAIEVHRKAF